ncbi:hypothetical protein A3C26_03255 [Candidatus Daviesbacteria bacterium RIFCSPHIGHO2_02_FULL_39_12]|uniref:Protein kinase domain-containing protein n=2 Tax=Candidatus Daviesiibacteriota TaxID=1752718 RepID=A0A1F5JDY2_9BACT|nr:MAG: hypothetical protein A3C26_03255 [Candidatus Daviesbacteria bacterium RIFCSPHIGHO2_02_FULL_39_12]OGE71902.1 MAG: hypothetical protein A3H40_03410 [Candidatus Daviesbacteria bacterium RIFCSPLOWO2_02_FULL_38_15]
MEAPVIPPELKEELALTAQHPTVEVNGYRTRGIPLELLVEGKKGIWHSVKGGFTPEPTRPHPIHRDFLSFEVLFNGETNEWLKVVPPESYHTVMLIGRLRRSVGMIKSSLEIAGLPELIPTVRETRLDLRGEPTYGFISPHLGGSLEYCLNILTSGRKTKLTPSAAKFISRIYNIAFAQAVRLYLDYGHWTADPGPGNILINTQNGLRVVLIDFANKEQHVINNFNGTPFEDKREGALTQNIVRLFELFKQQCNLHNITMTGDAKSELARFTGFVLAPPISRGSR